MSSSVLTKALAGVISAGATSAVPRALATVASGASFKLPDMPYDYGALEPHLSGQIMEIHHKKHHQAYVTNLNVAMEKYLKAEAAGDVAEMISLQGAIRFNGGGHVNHSIFWQNLAPPGRGGGGEPSGSLKTAIDTRFGSFASLKTQLNAAGAGVQGSGWAWLVLNKTAGGRLDLLTCANQDPVSSVPGLVPILGIDVWEHAYYLQYKNVRPDYLNAIWGVINWGDAARRFDDASKPAA